MSSLNHSKSFFISSLLLFHTLCSLSYAGDELWRFRNIEDRLRIEENFRPLGHDFLLDISAALSTEIMDIVDDAEKAADTPGSTSAKVTAAQDFLRKYDKTEQFGFAKVQVGIPLPSFSLFGVGLKPNLRADGDLGASITLKAKSLDLSTFRISDIPGIPTEVVSILGNASFPSTITPGTDLVQYAVNQGAVSAATAAPYLNKYFMPDFTLPNIFIYAKNDFRFHLNFDFDDEEFNFGHFGLFYLLRTDKEVRITEQILKDNGKLADLKTKNTQGTLQTNIKWGHRWEWFQGYLALEDVKLATFSDTKGPVYNDYDPLIRLHLDTIFNASIFKFSPFLGLHKRKGYGVKQGYYGGLTSMMTAWGDRLHLSLRGTIDKEYFSVTPQIKLWIMQLEYTFRKVLDDTTVAGNKTSNIHSANFRIFF